MARAQNFTTRLNRVLYYAVWDILKKSFFCAPLFDVGVRGVIIIFLHFRGKLFFCGDISPLFHSLNLSLSSCQPLVWPVFLICRDHTNVHLQCMALLSFLLTTWFGISLFCPLILASPGTFTYLLSNYSPIKRWNEVSCYICLLLSASSVAKSLNRSISNTATYTSPQDKRNKVILSIL